MDKAVITGTFSDLKLVKSRSVLQLVVEVPIEAAGAALGVLGGVPVPGQEVHVALARLATHAEPKPKRGSLAQRCGVLCGDIVFLRFLDEKYGPPAPKDDFQAAAMVREICGVESRADFDTDAAAASQWQRLESEYVAWKQL